MACPSLKKMGSAMARREGNYASSNCPPREEITELELGLTLIPGSQTQRGSSNTFKQVAPNSRRALGENNLNTEQDTSSPIGRKNEPRPPRFGSPSIVQDGQRDSQAFVSCAVTCQYDKENEGRNRGTLSRNSTFAAQASGAESNVFSCRRLSSPFFSARFENAITDETEDEVFERSDSKQNYPYYRRSRKRRKLTHQGRTDHTSKGYMNRTSPTRENSSHSGIFQDLSRLDICKDVSLNDFDVPFLHISTAHRLKPCHDRSETVRPRALSAGTGNEGVGVGRLGQDDIVKNSLQPCRHWGGRCSKLCEWSAVNGGEGLEMEITDGSGSLRPASVSSLSSRRCETYMTDNLNGNNSIETTSNLVEVSTGFLGRESTASVLPRRQGHCSDEFTNSAWGKTMKNVMQKQPEVFGTCSPASPHHVNWIPNHYERRDEKMLVPSSDCDEVELLPPYLISSSSSSPSSSYHFHTASIVPIIFNLQRRASISMTPTQRFDGFPIPHTIGDSRKRSTSLPSLCFMKSSAAMDYSSFPLLSHPVSQEDCLSRPSQRSQEWSSATPVYTRLPCGQRGWIVPAPPLHGVEASLDPYDYMGIRNPTNLQQQQLNRNLWSHENNLPSSSMQQTFTGRPSSDNSDKSERQNLHSQRPITIQYGEGGQNRMHARTRRNSTSLPPDTDQDGGHALNDVIYAINLRPHHENMLGRVLRFVDTFPLEGAVHQGNPMDVAYVQSVDEVKRLKARVQELESANGGLSENFKRCNWQMNEMRMRHREVSENLGSKTKELEDQRTETQLWRHRAEQLVALSRESGPKRSSAATVFETVGLFSSEANFTSQPSLPRTPTVVTGATETSTDQFTTDAQSFSVSPEAVTQASAAPIHARVVTVRRGTSAATAIDLTLDESRGPASISPGFPASLPSGLSSEAQGLGPIEKLQRRVKHGADWMGEAHPLKRVKRPEAYRPGMGLAARRTHLAMSAQSASAATAQAPEAAKTAAETKVVGNVDCARVETKAVQRAVQRKEEQEQREGERARKLEREGKLRDDHKGRQDLVAEEKAEEEARERETQLLMLQIQGETFEEPSYDNEMLADFDFNVASVDEEFFPADEAQVGGEGEVEDDGLDAELDAAMAEGAGKDDGLEAELEAAMTEEAARRRE